MSVEESWRDVYKTEMDVPDWYKDLYYNRIPPWWMFGGITEEEGMKMVAEYQKRMELEALEEVFG